MKSSNTYHLFGWTGLFIAIMGALFFFSSGERTSSFQAVILLTSGASLFLIAIFYAISDWIKLFFWKRSNPFKNLSKNTWKEM